MGEQLTIKILVENGRYLASVDEFPGCVGIGKDEKSAIHELGKGILASMEKNVRNICEFISKPKVVYTQANRKPIDKIKLIERVLVGLGLSRNLDHDSIKGVDMLEGEWVPDLLSGYTIQDASALYNENRPMLKPSSSDGMDSEGIIITMPINFN